MNNALIALTTAVLFFGIMNPSSHANERSETAIFAGGCFWCMESDFEKIPGVLNVVSGYAGGSDSRPTYKNYAHKGHLEVVQVTYDPSVISYEQLLNSLNPVQYKFY